jgi:hypothetical protein
LDGHYKIHKNMSWSVQFIGKPEKVVEALNAESEKLNGQSKVEYDSALPHLVALVNENFGTGYPVKLAASGHGTVYTDKSDRQLTVSLESIYGLLV